MKKLSVAEKLFEAIIDFFYLFFSLPFLILQLIKVGTNEDCS